jgi:hypothetical protein
MAAAETVKAGVNFHCFKATAAIPGTPGDQQGVMLVVAKRMRGRVAVAALEVSIIPTRSSSVTAVAATLQRNLQASQCNRMTRVQDTSRAQPQG